VGERVALPFESLFDHVLFGPIHVGVEEKGSDVENKNR
jgi:hypothetical protein